MATNHEIESGMTADGFPIPPIPEGIELPAALDPTSLPLHEVQLWFVENTTVEERSELVTHLRMRRKQRPDGAA